jgi:hypothetical protein
MIRFEKYQLSNPTITIKHYVDINGISVDAHFKGEENGHKYDLQRNLGTFVRGASSYTKTVKSDNSQDLKDLFTPITLESLGVKDVYKIDVDIKFYVEITAENQVFFPVKVGTKEFKLIDWNGKKVIERWQQGEIERLFSIQFGEVTEVNLKPK